jgi:hypothetical protein
MGPTNSLGRFSGWNIDDLEVTSDYSGPMALYVPSGDSPNPNIDEIMIEDGFGIKHSDDVPSDLNDYSLLIVSKNEVCNLLTSDFIKNFVLNGKGALIMGGTPKFLAGNTSNLGSIRDWFGAGTYTNDCGYGTVAINQPFGTDLSVNDEVDYMTTNTCLADSVENLEPDATRISTWSKGQTVDSFKRVFGPGRVFYFAGNPGYPKDPNPTIIKNGLDLFEAGLVWAAAGCTSPMITTQPKSQTIQSGQAATLSVTATGTTPLSYQWYQGLVGDTSNPVEANSSSYTTPGLTQTTSYWVRVTNSCGSANSNAVTVTVAVNNLTYGVSGRIVAPGGAGISGASVMFKRVSGNGALPSSVSTDSNGNWNQSGFESGTTYRATPGKSFYKFDPAHLDFSLNTSSVNFTGSTTRHKQIRHQR